MSLKPPQPGSPGFNEWRDLAEAVDAAGFLGAGLLLHAPSGEWLAFARSVESNDALPSNYRSWARELLSKDARGANASSAKSEPSVRPARSAEAK